MLVIMSKNGVQVAGIIIKDDGLLARLVLTILTLGSKDGSWKMFPKWLPSFFLGLFQGSWKEKTYRPPPLKAQCFISIDIHLKFTERNLGFRDILYRNKNIHGYK